jgi:MarR family transcriptional regulator, lower aerobic nicotinate degradation pathway regulator
MGSQLMSTSQRVLDSIRRLVRLLREESRASEESVGLSGAQLFVLQKLDAERPLSLNELAARTLTHQSSVSVVVSRLVDRGLVQRRPAASDARRLELLLTKRGQLLRDRAPTPSQDRVIAAVAALPDKQQRELAAALEELVHTLGLDARAAPMLFADEPAPRRRAQRKRGNTRRA